MRQSRRATCLVAAAAALLASSCSQNRPYTLVANEGQLPPELTFPALTGDVGNAVEQICDWAAAEQIPFRADEAGAIYVETAIGPDGGRHLPWRLVGAFLQSSQAPQELVLSIDTSVPVRPMRGAEALYRIIDEPGLWMLTKSTSNENCPQRDAGYAIVTRDNLALCVHASAIDVVPEDITTRADVRNLYYQLRGGTILTYQMLHLQILTLNVGDSVAGRSIRAKFYAGPNVLGGVNRACEPAPSALAFESPA